MSRPPEHPNQTRQRLLGKVVVAPNGCWVWHGFVTAQGYGACGFQGKRNTLAHRAVYTLLKGSIPVGLTLDHLCHTLDLTCTGGVTCPHRRCVNPLHVEPVTYEENASRSVYTRKTHCPQGHPYAGENLGRNKVGGRFCRTCGRARARERHHNPPTLPTRVIKNPRPRLANCRRGHPFDEANTAVLPTGERRCRACSRDRSRRARQAKRQVNA